MTFGPAESFTPQQFAQLYDVNVLGTQRVNRAALPHLRKQGRALLIWVSSSSGNTLQRDHPRFHDAKRNGRRCTYTGRDVASRAFLSFIMVLFDSRATDILRE
jgi:NAD(P)-dependent dehydrogenase (short-subunit alcohol dehydrogenase family)